MISKLISYRSLFKNPSLKITSIPGRCIFGYLYARAYVTPRPQLCRASFDGYGIQPLPLPTSMTVNLAIENLQSEMSILPIPRSQVLESGRFYLHKISTHKTRLHAKHIARFMLQSL
jgi:hypothetical protein